MRKDSPEWLPVTPFLLVVIAVILCLTTGCNYNERITCYSAGTIIYEKSGVITSTSEGRWSVYFPSGKTDYVSGQCVTSTMEEKVK